MTAEREGGGPDPAGSGGKARVTGARVGVGLLVATVVVLVILLDAALGNRPAFRAAAPGTAVLVAFLSAFALREFYALLEARGVRSHARFASNASFLLLALRGLAPAAGVRTDDAAAAALVGALLVLLAPVAAAIAFRREGTAAAGAEEGADVTSAVDALPGTAAGLLAVHLPLALLLELRLVTDVLGMDSPVPAGLVLTVMVVVACKVGDSAAYFAGRTIGRIPFCWISPKKTWEGAIAGVLAGGGAAAVLGLAMKMPLSEALAFGLVANLAGQAGDLLESALKRACGAKDSGRTFGEMGGALDLVDALLLAAPAAWLFHRIVLA